MSTAVVPNGPLLLDYDGSENAKAAIRRAGRQLCDGRREIVLTVRTSRAVAERSDADVVVVGSHTRAGIIRLLLRSIAAATTGYTEPPVLIVHGG
jgi:nucleotide-binding universal stress UspA family protein